MRTRMLLALSFLALLAIELGLLLPTPRLVLLGWLRGEAFYQNRPVCWWSDQLQDWSTGSEFKPLNFINAPFPRRRIAGTTSVGEEDTLYIDPDETNWVAPSRFPGKRFNKWLGRFTKIEQSRLPLFEGDPAAVPVLRELLQDANPTVLRIAMKGVRCAGGGARSVVPVLHELLHHANPIIRQEARYTLRSLDAPVGE